MPDAPRVSVIIPAWNLWELTAACLRSLAAHSQGENLEVVVVDNGSTDATATELEPLGRALFGAAFRPVRLAENQGFARGCNAGAAAAAGPLLFFLNNDATVTPGWLPPLRAALESPRVGAVGPLLLYPDRTVQHCGIFITPFHTVGHLYEHFPAGHPAVARPHPLQALTGAALLLRAADFQDCGGFFTGYRNGFEDLDLCCALRARGRKLRVAAQSVVLHHTSRTPGRFDHDQANGELFARRCGAALRPDWHLLAALDGYRLCLGPGLALWLEPEPERQEACARAWREAGMSPEACVHLLEKEPLWREGWLRLARRLADLGRAEEAFAAALRCGRFFPHPEVGALLLRLARALGDPQCLREVMEIVASLPQAHALTEVKRARLRQARRRAIEAGDDLLAGLCARWLRTA